MADGGEQGQQGLQGAVGAWDQAAWCLAALALVARGDGPAELTAAARELLAAAGLPAGPGGPLAGRGGAAGGQVASQAAAALFEASALAGAGYGWGSQSDEVLVAQGRVSAQRAVTVARLLVPVMGDLAGRLALPGARLLDVGTGTGALAVAFAQVFPRVQVVGIDIFDRALGLARQAIAASGAGARVVVRKQDVAEFADDGGFDLAWLPAPFVAGPALRAGLPRVVAALRPGGWLIVGHGKSGGTPAQDALTRLKTLAYGGTPIDGAAARQLLHQAGLASVRTVPTPAGAPAITIGHNPA